jgi:cold shock CspA family protein
MASGTVKWFNGPSGFGVITPDADGAELFVYRGSLVAVGATLDAGDRVEFEVHEGGMGPQAVDVRTPSGEV